MSRKLWQHTAIKTKVHSYYYEQEFDRLKELSNANEVKFYLGHCRSLYRKGCMTSKEWLELQSAYNNKLKDLRG